MLCVVDCSCKQKSKFKSPTLCILVEISCAEEWHVSISWITLSLHFEISVLVNYFIDILMEGNFFRYCDNARILDWIRYCEQ